MSAGAAGLLLLSCRAAIWGAGWRWYEEPNGALRHTVELITLWRCCYSRNRPVGLLNRRSQFALDVAQDEIIRGSDKGQGFAIAFGKAVRPMR